MDGQDHSALEPLSLQPPGDRHHRPLHQIGRGPLNGCVPGDPLGPRPEVAVPTPDVGQGPPSAEQRGHVTGLLRLLDHLVHEALHPLVALEEGVDVALGLAPLDPQVARQGELGLAVDHREVHRLALAALLAGDLVGGHLEEGARRPAVHVLALGEGVHQLPIPAQVREDPELDLAVVGGQEQAAIGGHEGVADAPTELGADGDVLEVRVGRAEPAGLGDRLVVSGVDPPGLRIDRLGEGAEVGPLDLRHRAVLDDRPG